MQKLVREELSPEEAAEVLQTEVAGSARKLETLTSRRVLRHNKEAVLFEGMAGDFFVVYAR